MGSSRRATRNGEADLSKNQKLTAYETSRQLGDAIAAMPVKIEEGKADKEQVFLIYAGACGDIVKTAKACGITPQEVAEMASDGDWLKRIGELIDLKKFDKFDDVGRALSRTFNFVQANRWRMFLERVIRRLEEIPDSQVLNEFKTWKVDNSGEARVTGFSVRVLADISSALEKCHWLLYQSLQDTSTDRAARKAAEKPGETGGESDMHARIARTMAGLGLKTPIQHAEDAQALITKPVVENPA